MDNTALIIIDMQKDFVGEGENTVVLSHIVDFVVEIGCLLFFVMSCFWFVIIGVWIIVLIVLFDCKKGAMPQQCILKPSSCCKNRSGPSRWRFWKVLWLRIISNWTWDFQALLNFCRPAGITIIHTREGHHPNMTDCPRNKVRQNKTQRE
jgi:hypothetical protein